MAGSTGWFADPYRRHEHRYYDGAQWTENVADAGVQSVDHVDPGTPHSQETPQPVAAPKSKSGCLPWLGGAAAIVFLVIVGFVVLVVVLLVVSASDDDDHPPRKDVAITACAPNGLGGYWRTEGTIVNHSSERSDYTVRIGYFKGATRIGSSSTFESDVDPGARVTWDSGDISSGDVAGPVQCRIIDVSRHASL